MKTLAFACATMLFATAASASEPVAKPTLSSMGLGSMQQMSDTDGLAVRGKGTYASVWGGSQANIRGGQYAYNRYNAGAAGYGNSNAVGDSFSFAGKAKLGGSVNPTGFYVKARITSGFAGGGASAHAW